MKVNLHTHTTYCDGNNSPEEMVLDAISAGFDVLGFSGHSYTSFDQSYCMSREQTDAYIVEIRALAEKYKEKIKVFCGIEKDFFADDSAECYDYAIGSVHAIYKSCDAAELANLRLHAPKGIHITDNGCYIYIDWKRETLEWAAANIYRGDSLALAEAYYDHVARIADMTDVQIVGHFDLLTKFEEQRMADGLPPLFDTAHPRYLEAASRAADALSKAGKIFEINTGAMPKGYRTSPYPSLPLLQMIQQADGRITINSDCHAAGKLDCGYQQALQLAEEAGFSSITILAPDGQWKEISLTEVLL